MEPTRRRLTLSFDNGPDPEVTPGVLDALAERDLQATFFVCGKDARGPAQREILERAHAEGHRIGNHTQTHTIELGTTEDPAVVATEIGEAQRALGELASAERWFRPYGGGGVIGPKLLSQAAVEYLTDGGYSVVLWNSVPRDWEDPQGWPDRAEADVRARDWTLVVLHDVRTGAMKALPRFLDRVLDGDVEIVQEFPSDCVPLARGEALLPLDGIVAAGARAPGAG